MNYHQSWQEVRQQRCQAPLSERLLDSSCQQPQDINTRYNEQSRQEQSRFKYHNNDDEDNPDYMPKKDAECLKIKKIMFIFAK